MAEQKQDDQLEHTYGSYARIRDVALKTYQRRLTIGRGGERGSGISVLAARHDNDDDDALNLVNRVHRTVILTCWYSSSFRGFFCTRSYQELKCFIPIDVNYTSVLGRIFGLVWFGWVSRYINHCWLFNAKLDLFIYSRCISYLNISHHHHVVPLARISLTLSRHFSLSFRQVFTFFLLLFSVKWIFEFFSLRSFLRQLVSFFSTNLAQLARTLEYTDWIWHKITYKDWYAIKPKQAN